MTRYSTGPFEADDELDVRIDAGGQNDTFTGSPGGSTPEGGPPAATDDEVIVTEGESVTFDPRVNDTDPDGDPISITGASIISGGGTISHTATSVTITADNGAVAGTDIVAEYTISDDTESDTGQITATVADAGSGTGGEITQDQTYSMTAVEGDWKWHASANKRFNSFDNSYADLGTVGTRSAYSHPDGINNIKRDLYVNDVLINKSDQSANGYWQKIVAGDEIHFIDTVTTKVSAITEAFTSATYTVPAATTPPAPDIGDVSVANSPSLDGNELRMTISGSPNMGNCKLSHYEVSTDGGTDWNRVDGFGANGDWPILVEPAFSDIRVRAVNRLNIKGAVLTISSGLPTPTTGTPTVTITAPRGTSRPGPAPFAFLVECWGFSVWRPKHELDFAWTYPATVRTEGRYQGRIWGADGTKSYGGIGGCVFDHELIDFAGGASVVETVSCEVTRISDGTGATSGTLDVTILDPFQHHTIAVVGAGDTGNDSLWSEAPAGATRFNDWGDAVRALKNTDNAMVLFKRGESHACADPSNATLDAGGDLSYGAWGTGDPPSPTGRPLGFGNSTTGNNYVWGLDLPGGGYDPSDPYVSATRPGNNIVFSSQNDATSLEMVWDCDLSGGDSLLSMTSGVEGQVIAGCYFHDWHNYAFLNGTAGEVLIMYCDIRQDPAATWSEGKKNWPPNQSAWHTARLTRADDWIAIINVDLLSANDWTESGPDRIQPAFRALRAMERGQHIVLNRVIAEGGDLGIGNGSEYRYHGGNDVVFDDILICPAGAVGQLHRIHYTGGTYRNLVFLGSDWDNGDGGFNRFTVVQGPQIWLSDEETLPVEIINPGFMDHRSLANRTSGSNVRSYTETGIEDKYSFRALPGFAIYNALRYAPSAPNTPPEGFDNGFDLTTAVYDPEYAGYFTHDGTTLTSETQYALQDAPLLIPVAGSTVIGDCEAPTKVPLRDFFGTSRADPPARGPITVGSSPTGPMTFVR